MKGAHGMLASLTRLLADVHLGGVLTFGRQSEKPVSPMLSYEKQAPEQGASG